MQEIRQSMSSHELQAEIVRLREEIEKFASFKFISEQEARDQFKAYADQLKAYHEQREACQATHLSQKEPS